MKYEHNNISPLDSRYANKILDTRDCFSEYTLIKERFNIEIDWLIYLCSNKNFPKISKNSIKKLYEFKSSFSDKEVLKIKRIENKTNHDVKAVEYFIKDYCLKDRTLSKYVNLIHFGLTSEDINSLAYAVIIKNGINIHLQKILFLNKKIKNYSKQWKNIPFLSRTHGQAASPSTLGKEMKVFSSRIDREISLLKSITPLAKFSGATGNYHTFNLVDNKVNWPVFNKRFINSFGVIQNQFTTQIEPHDWISETAQAITRVNNILIDLSQDMWIYISNEIFALKVNVDEVGSSTMPHKVNPIDFENAEGNFGISNSMNEFFVNKLTKSRMQRDLSDSTVLRNIGLSFGYSQLAISSISKGLDKVKPNKEVILNELNNNWEVLTEAVQTIMRYEGIDNAYEQLKSLSRGNKLNKQSYLKFVSDLPISDKSKEKLLKLTPSKYIGLANKL